MSFSVKVPDVVVEGNNAFGERHCYLPDTPQDGQELKADKVFHVSPFCTLEGGYRFRFLRTGNDGLKKNSGPHRLRRQRRPATENQRERHAEAPDHCQPAKALWGSPAMTLGVIDRIHGQAWKLWCSRAHHSEAAAAPEVRHADGPAAQRLAAALWFGRSANGAPGSKRSQGRRLHEVKGVEPQPQPGWVSAKLGR